MGKVVRYSRNRRNRRKPAPRRFPIASPLVWLVIIGLASALYFTFEPQTNNADGSGGTIEGRASVIDGDTLDIGRTRFRLHGIDAPESSQSCSVKGEISRCGQLATRALAGKIGSNPVACEPKDRDQYNRVVAICRSGGEDLNAWMVGEGWAMAYRQYSGDYIQQEASASTSKRGIWQGDFVAPWDWRQGERLAVTEAPRSQSCPIKGNVSRGGEHIYHVPGGRYYEPTRIDASKGERWFCSEVEAQEAGWRKSLR